MNLWHKKEPVEMSDDSVERLYAVNRMRDILLEKSVELEKRSVLKVLGYGSTIKGTANHDSDIDICFVVNLEEGKTGDEVYLERMHLEQIMSDDKFPQAHQFLGGMKKKRTTHVQVEYVRDRKYVKPFYIDDCVILWESEKLSL